MRATEVFATEKNRLSKYQKAKEFVDYLEKKSDMLDNPEDIEDFNRRIQAKQALADKARSEIVDRIYLLDRVVFCEILELHFIEGVSLPDIADRLGYTERHIRQLYSDAIYKLAEEYDPIA